MKNQELWQAVLAQIQFHVSRANFATWFRNTKIIDKEKGGVVISVPNTFSREWLNNKYQNQILKILRSLDQNVRSVEFIVQGQEEVFLEDRPVKIKEPLGPQLQFQEFKLDQKTNLNPNYTFENFVVGSFNELAHAASWAISEKPGSVYNPLFIYGGVGLGKTHLLQATGNRITNQLPEKNVNYTTSERFISSIVEAIKNRTIEQLKQKLARVDVLIIDDVQFFAGKEKTQEEFFHVFNSLYQNQKQIILSSDRPPNAIPAIEERLRSRFEGGMIADIGSPDLETRLAILKAKCEDKEIELADDILQYIASHIQRNIREMEGALNRIIVFYKINEEKPALAAVKKLLDDIINAPKKATNFKNIIQAVANFYDLKNDDLLLKTRRKEIVKPRQIAMYLIRYELNESYPSIGRKFKGKDHTTAIYACEKVKKQLESNENLLTEINLIKQRIYSEL